MSLYERFLLLNMFRMLLRSSSGADDCMWVYCSVSVCTGVLVRFGRSRVVSECRLEYWWFACVGWSGRGLTCTQIPPYSSRTVPIHQYTPKQSNTHSHSRQLLRMNVITFETCWAIKNFHKVTSSWFNLFNKYSIILTYCFTVTEYKYIPYKWSTTLPDSRKTVVYVTCWILKCFNSWECVM
jgi:hypothetical protein